MKIFNIVGARPNFMKVAPLHRAFEANGAFDSYIIHTGQHYDHSMSDVFFQQLQMPKPYRHLGVGSGSHAEQTASVMTAFEKVVLEEKPDAVIVVGDVNSTLACSLVCAKLGISVAHVEAGLRSFDRSMPEEVNRLVTDTLADWLFVSEPSGVVNLKKEGIADEKIFFVGNVMIDSLVSFQQQARQSNILNDLKLTSKQFILATIHRPANVDVPENLKRVVGILHQLTAIQPVVLPLHPRTQSQLIKSNLLSQLQSLENLLLTEPCNYLNFLHLLETASLVITDSGGIQEETTFLQTPCLTIRDSTERPATIDFGTNELIALDATLVAKRAKEVLQKDFSACSIPELWDGQASLRIAEILQQQLKMQC